MNTANLPATLSIGSVLIRQQNGRYCLNDLHQASGGDAKHQPSNFIRLDTTRALIMEISNSSDVRNYKPIEIGRGKYGGTYACRELVIAYAAWISAEFHLRVIRVFLDSVNSIPPQPLPPPPPRTRTLTFTVPEGDTHQRWLLHTDRMGREIVTPLSPDTHIATPERLVKMFIQKPAGLNMTPEQHMTIIGASLHHLVSPAIGVST